VRSGRSKSRVEEPCRDVYASKLESITLGEVHTLLPSVFERKPSKASMQVQKACASTAVLGQKLGVNNWCPCVSDAIV
jgi:hypothetical protein